MKHAATAAALLCLVAPLHATEHATEGERVQITGEIIDTWCYYSGVMGPPESTTGTAHHTCALWCSAGGIPVGLRDAEGEVYMVLKIEGDDTSASGDTQLRLASHEIVADGMLYRRDGLNYLVVETVVADNGIVNQTHDDWGVIPGFAIPDPEGE
ncbi:MAG: hypothetical protein AAGL23_10205 [Pseudomonadota bacterium]